MNIIRSFNYYYYFYYFLLTIICPYRQEGGREKGDVGID